MVCHLQEAAKRSTKPVGPSDIMGCLIFRPCHFVRVNLPATDPHINVTNTDPKEIFSDQSVFDTSPPPPTHTHIHTAEHTLNARRTSEFDVTNGSRHVVLVPPSSEQNLKQRQSIPGTWCIRMRFVVAIV